MRQSRKLDHLKYSLALGEGPGKSGFADISLLHNCLPNLDWDSIDISTALAGIKLSSPLIINAITGGAKDVAAVNGQIAEFACRTNTAMAVGSQFAALEDPEVEQSYKIVREKNPKGVIFANLGAYATPNQAQLAVEMIDAQALQIHLNVAQELIMSEGDREFTGYLANIAKIVRKVRVPVIVKEVGCGIAYEQAQQLAEVGIQGIDIGGKGGTNFMAIEAARSQLAVQQELLAWGIPTAISAIEVQAALPKQMDMMVSGGIRTPLDVIKALVLGGVATGMATPIIKLLYEKDMELAIDWFHHFVHEIKCYMALVGAERISNLTKVPIVITGHTREWLTARGIDLTKYEIQKQHG